MAIALKVGVGIIGLLFALLGLSWMFTPSATAADLGITLGDAVALNTARGDLGGMFLAAALLCGWGLRSGDGRWLQAVAVLVASVALGRSLGIAIDGFAAPSAIAISLELVIVAVLLLAARRPAAA